jgi:hypothetical protein
MCALSADRNTAYRDGIELEFPVKAAAKIYAGSMVCLEGASGYAIPAADASGNQFIGVALEQADNTGAGNGAITVRVRRTGVFEFAASSIAQAQVGDVMYIVDDQTVDETNPGNSVIAGRLVKYVSATKGWVDITLGTYLATTAAASTTAADSGNFFVGANVEAILAEIGQHIKSVQSFIPVSLMQLREASNFNVGNVAANGGLLASDTTPILAAINGATDGCQMVTWAASNNDQVVFQVPLPPDLDDTADLVLHFRTKSGGTTNAVGFTVDSFFNEGASKVIDTSETNQTTTWAEKIATIAAADVPVGAQTLTVGLTPAAHTSDTLNLSAIWIEYKKKLLTS